MESNEETELEKVQKHRDYLAKRLREVTAHNKNLKEEAERQKGVADQNYTWFVQSHRAVNLLREDANRVMAENGVQELQRELEHWREEYLKLRGRRAQWTALTRRSVMAKAEATTLATEQGVALKQMHDEVVRIQADRASAVEAAQKVIEVMQARQERIAEQCRLWKSGQLDTMTTIAGITGEMQGHQLPEPGSWERAKAIREAVKEAALNAANKQLSRVADELHDAGIGIVSTHAAAVRDLTNQREAAYDKIGELEAEISRWLAFIERGQLEHMRFGVIAEDGTAEMLPCADWCYVCKIDRLEGEIKALKKPLDGPPPEFFAQLMSTSEVGEMIGRTRQRVSQLAEKGDIRVRAKLRNGPVFWKPDVEKFVPRRPGNPGKGKGEK